MYDILVVLQVVISILLVLVILSQDRGTGLSATFGGGAGGGGFHRSKRGAEKVLANLTVVLAVAFILVAFAFNFVE